MKIKKILQILTVFTIMLAIMPWMERVCFGAVIDRTSLVGASATKERIIDTSNPLHDNFNYGRSENSWGDVTGIFSSANPPTTNVFCTASYTDNPAITFGDKAYSLQLDYSVLDAGSFVGYASNLAGADLSSYNYISFWVKGDVGGEFFKIEMKNNETDANKNAAHIYVTDYLQGGVTTAWEKVTIPLDAFANIDNWTSAKEFVIVFENVQSLQNGSSTSGRIYMDNISFGFQFLGFVNINTYGDKGTTNALGGQSNFVSWNGTSAYGEITPLEYNTSPYSLEYNFTGMGVWHDRWASYYYIIGGGTDGWIESPRDFSAYSEFSFDIKGKTGNECGIRAELNSATQNCYRFLRDIITSDWKHIVVPLSEFKTGDSHGSPTGTSVDTTTLKKCAFTYSYWLVGWGGISNGGFYIDDVRFQISGYTPDTTPSSAPSNPVINMTSQPVILTATASSRSTDPSMENVRFEYEESGAWKTIGYDYDTANDSYLVEWYTTNLSPGSYDVRAIAMDSAGNVNTSGNEVYIKS